MTISQKRNLCRQSQFANMDNWEKHLKDTLSSGVLVNAQINEDEQSSCRFVTFNGSVFTVESTSGETHDITASHIISIAEGKDQ